MTSHLQHIPVRVVLDNIRSGLNVGSIFRTSDAFAIQGIDLCGYTARPPHRDILKSALGATESTTWRGHETTRDCLQSLKDEGWKIAAIEQFPQSIHLTHWTVQSSERWAVIMGNEVRGVDPQLMDLMDCAVEIPQFGVKKSLNVSVCAGIVLHHLHHTLQPA